MLSYLEYLNKHLNIPTKFILALVIIFFVMQIIGELIDLKGDIVPEFVKIRKYFSRKKKEKNEHIQTLKAVKTLLSDVNAHYSEDNIAKRDSWMDWVNSRAKVYDTSIESLKDAMSDVIQTLKDNTKMTEEMFIQSSRDRIIDFANRVADNSVLVSKEEFNRIFKVYKKYEDFLEERELTNGEIDIAFKVIEEGYEYRLKHHSFVEDVKGYK